MIKHLRLMMAALLTLGSASACAAAISVVFLNPGKADEPYWRSVTRFMEPAARQLDINLQVLYAERDHLRLLDLMRQVAARPAKPDYVILVNEKLAGGEMLKMAARAGIKVLFAFNTLEHEQSEEFGFAREKYRGWLGSITPNSVEAGRSSAVELVRHAGKARLAAPDGKIHVALIGGDKVTPTGVQRLEGAMRALQAMPDVVIDQAVYGNWQRERAQEQAKALLQRHPHIAAIWTASDLMTFGAIDAAEAAGRKAGKDILFAAFNNSPEVLRARVDGRISALAGGHFTTGAWALVLLHDYHHGADFVSEGLHQQLPLFSILDADMAQRFLSRFGNEDFSAVDFRQFSKALNPARKRYDFGLPAVLR